MAAAMSLSADLDRDIWHEFVRSYAALDTEAFLGLHAPELIRAGGPGREMLDFPRYAADIREFFATVASRGDAVAIEFAFTERLAGGGLASDRGVYRLTITLAGGERRVQFGRFHVLARHGDGRWRIVADYDAPEGADETAFAAAEPLAAAGPV